MSRKHNRSGRKLGRNINQRKALFKSLINSLILNESVNTTTAKAKAIQGLFDKLLNKAKLGTVHVRRLLQAFLGDTKAVNKLVDEIAPRMKARPSGFTRIVKLGRRRGDDAPIVKMTLVEKEAQKDAKEAAPSAKKTAPKTKK